MTKPPKPPHFGRIVVTIGDGADLPPGQRPYPASDAPQPSQAHLGLPHSDPSEPHGSAPGQPAQTRQAQFHQAQNYQSTPEGDLNIDPFRQTRAAGSRAKAHAQANRPRLPALPAAPSSDHSAGYGRPPDAHKFRKGVSGNPKGRPRGAKNKLPALNEERLKSIVVEEAYRTLKVADKGKTVSISVAQAVMRGIALSAAKGQPRAQRLFTELLWTTEAQDKRLYDDYLQTAIQYKVGWEEELDRRKRLGITHLPEPLPHPDHIEIDFRTSRVRILGPMTKQHKVQWDKLRARKREALAEIERLKIDVQAYADSDPGYADFLKKEIQWEQQVYDNINKHIKD